MSGLPFQGIARFLKLTGTCAGLTLAFAVLGADESAPVQKPDVKVGDSWTYRIQEYQSNVPITITIETRVSFTGPDVIMNVEKGRDGRESESQFGSDWSFHSIGNVGQVFDPPMRFFRFPLQVGAEYPFNYAMVAQRGSPARTRAEGTAKVLGWEDVAVPAGKFRALKIEARTSFQRLDTNFRGWQRYVLWYAPAAKRWVKFTFEAGGRAPNQLDLIRDLELVEFKVQ